MGEVGITPYMRCTMCRRVMRVEAIHEHIGCICGQTGFTNTDPTLWEKFTCWLLRR